MIKSMNKKGFTIIEVVIVLVIAAIIMLMVFLVVPFLQRSQRDARRQDAARRYVAAVEQYATNQNNGQYPDSVVDAIETDYIQANEFIEPTTNTQYDVQFGIGKPDSAGKMLYSNDATCSGAESVTGGGAGRFAVVVFQENGGSFCVAN